MHSKSKYKDYIEEIVYTCGRQDFKLALAQPTVVKISSKRSASQKR